MSAKGDEISITLQLRSLSLFSLIKNEERSFNKNNMNCINRESIISLFHDESIKDIRRKKSQYILEILIMLFKTNRFVNNYDYSPFFTSKLPLYKCFYNRSVLINHKTLQQN